MMVEEERECGVCLWFGLKVVVCVGGRVYGGRDVYGGGWIMMVWYYREGGFYEVVLVMYGDNDGGFGVDGV